MEIFEEMLGYTINKIWINENNDVIKFETTGGNFVYYTEGDCCNTVWFEHISLSPKLFGSFVMGVEEKGWNDLPVPDDSYEVLENAFWTLITSNGYIDIEVRNSHNGYYGGRITYDDNGTFFKADTARELTEDF
jgi:hypothetical protein